MAGIILGAAAPVEAPPPVVPSPWPGLAAMTWTGWDGSVWDLLTGAQGVLLTAEGVRGMSMPPIQRYTSSSPAVAGTRWKGSRTDEREVFWPILLDSEESSAQWVARDKAFWKTMHPDRPGIWSVTSVGGSTRTLRCRFASDGDHSYDVEPSSQGWAAYGITLVAEQPYWQGAPAQWSWSNAAAVPFFGGVPGGSGPPFVISSGLTIAGAAVSNPGDVDGHLVYTITGPTTSVSVGYAGSVVSLGTIAGGQSRIVDTHPDQLTVVDQNGVDRWSELGAVAEFDSPVPPGLDVALSLSMVGAGTVSAVLVPDHFKAW